jgi:hypothetical protein
MFKRASEDEEEPAGQTALSPDLTGMDDGELAERLLDRIRTGNIVAAEELEISSERGLIRLEGFLPSERSRKILLQHLADTLGTRAVEDRIVTDRLLWAAKDGLKKEEELFEHDKIGQDDHLPGGGNLGGKQFGPEGGAEITGAGRRPDRRSSSLGLQGQ